ncbi:MAG: efflux RND transporter periplasmic adaptor subunit, partial [Bacteroidales bacterium]|nr:efflux RND transporter periplasmic adaptor subunit [Bacteroidales bacterium]
MQTVNSFSALMGNARFVLRSHPLLLLLLLPVLQACGGAKEVTPEEPEGIILTEAQFAADSMRLGLVETRLFERMVKANGTIEPLPAGIAGVNAPVPGLIKAIHCHNGQVVSQHQALVDVGGSAVIDHQTNYVEAVAEFRQLKSEFERVKALFDEKVVAEKEFIRAEAALLSASARYNGLRIKLLAMGFSLSKVEQGDFYTTYTLKAPIAGVISSLPVHLGHAVDQQTELLTITNPSMLQVRLSVFPSDAALLKPGQRVRLKRVNETKVHEGSLTAIGVGVNTDTKAIDAYASLPTSKEARFMAMEYLAADIIAHTDSVKAVPDEALIKSDADYFVLVLDKQLNDRYVFSPVNVSIGRRQKGYTELLNPTLSGQLLAKGAYGLDV